MPGKKNIAVYDLARRKTKTVGIIVHKLDSHFMLSALKSIQKMTTENGYEVIITHSQESLEKEAANARLLFDRGVDGVLASLSAETRDTAHFTSFMDKGVPVVFFDCMEKMPDNDTVVIDHAGCGFLAAEHLIRQGCRRIAIISADLERGVYAERYKGFRNALEKYNMTFSKELLITADIGIDDGMDAARRVLRMRPLPDGLFITNDLAAAACMHTLKEAGIRVPDDIAIVGFNNDPVGRLITPALTTIDNPGFEIGRTAATRLLDYLSGNGYRDRQTTAVVPPALIIRASSLRSQAS